MNSRDSRYFLYLYPFLAKKPWIVGQSSYSRQSAQVSSFLIIFSERAMYGRVGSCFLLLTIRGSAGFMAWMNSRHQSLLSFFLSPKEIPLEDFARETGFSHSSVSNKTDILEMTGCIIRVRKAGSKKVYLYSDVLFQDDT